MAGQGARRDVVREFARFTMIAPSAFIVADLGDGRVRFGSLNAPLRRRDSSTSRTCTAGAPHDCDEGSKPLRKGIGDAIPARKLRQKCSKKPSHERGVMYCGFLPEGTFVETVRRPRERRTPRRQSSRGAHATQPTPAFDFVDSEVVAIYFESIFVVALAPLLLVARRGAIPTHRLRAV